MEAPKGRYRVLEKDGRLVVIDNESGRPIPSTLAPPPPAGPGRAASGPSSPAESGGPGPIERAADVLLAMAVRQWDAEGRAVIAWEWRSRGRKQRWDARLDRPQQRRLGRALLALCALPVFILAMILGEGALLGLPTLLAFPFIAWGAIALVRLYHETDDPGLRG